MCKCGIVLHSEIRIRNQSLPFPCEETTEGRAPYRNFTVWHVLSRFSELGRQHLKGILAHAEEVWLFSLPSGQPFISNSHPSLQIVLLGWPQPRHDQIESAALGIT